MTLTEVGKQDLQSWRAYHLSERIGQSAYMSTKPRRLLMTELVLAELMISFCELADPADRFRPGKN